MDADVYGKIGMTRAQSLLRRYIWLASLSGPALLILFLIALPILSR